MDILIDRENPKKLYVQLLEILRAKIESNEWPVDAQIPTEDELCQAYEVSKATVRLAVSDLVRSGYLLRRQGRGTFVCKRIFPEGLSMLTSFKEIMLEAGVVFTTKVLAQTVIMPTEDMNLLLEVPEDTHIIYIKRLRIIENEPVVLQETFLPLDVCPQLIYDDLENNSLLELLEKKYHLKVTKVQDFIEVSQLQSEESTLLALPPMTAALLLEQRFFSGSRQIMYTRSLKRPERFRFFLERERKA